MMRHWPCFDISCRSVLNHSLRDYSSVIWSTTLLAKKVVTPRDDVSFCDYFYFISPRGLRTGCLV